MVVPRKDVEGAEVDVLTTQPEDFIGFFFIYFLFCWQAERNWNPLTLKIESLGSNYPTAYKNTTACVNRLTMRNHACEKNPEKKK